MKPAILITLLAISFYAGFYKADAKGNAFAKDVALEAYRQGNESIILKSLDYKPVKKNPGIDRPLRIEMLANN